MKTEILIKEETHVTYFKKALSRNRKNYKMSLKISKKCYNILIRELEIP